jgi:catechol 2,3-dioxygenase-like lactoylglutathione lyase family enzyme
MSFTLRGICPLLQVYDMPASLVFYRNVLGFEVVGASPPAETVSGDDFYWIWLRRDGTDLMLNTAYDPDAVRPQVPDAARVAAHDDTILYMGTPDVDAVYEHLRSRGLEVPPPTVAHYGMKQLYVKDPDGFGICFQWKAEGTE